MARDYAKRFYISSQKKRSNTKWFVLVGVIIVLACLGMIIALKANVIFSGNPQIADALTHIKSIFVKQAPATAANKMQKKQTIPQPEVQFSFYNELPHMHVEVPATNLNNVASPQKRGSIDNKVSDDTSTGKQVQVPVSGGTTPAADKPTYYLQFGSFKEESAASQLRLSLLLAGIESEVEKVESSQGEAYRVWQGNYATMTEANAYQQKWRKKGVESVIKKDT